MKRWCGVLIVLCGVMCAAFASAQKVSEAQLKALYLYKIAKFVSWESGSKQSVHLCYIESSNATLDASVGQQLSKYVTQKNKQDMKVIHLKNLQEISSCDMLFIASSEQSALSNILPKVADKSILTVSDIKRFIFREGMIGFVTDSQNRVQMEANLRIIKSSGMRMSASALEVMVQVVQ
jgi:hypothetical protein